MRYCGLDLPTIELMVQRDEVNVLDDATTYYCKICDTVLSIIDKSSHYNRHLDDIKSLKNERQDIADENRRVGLKRSHDERKRKKEEDEIRAKVEAEDLGLRRLWCVKGHHFWNREPTRGRVPKSCEQHR